MAGAWCEESTALLRWSAMLSKDGLGFSSPASVCYFIVFHGESGKVSNVPRPLTNSAPACCFSSISSPKSKHHLVVSAQSLHYSSNCSSDSSFLHNYPHTHGFSQRPSVLAARYTIVAAWLYSGVPHLLCPGCLKLVSCLLSSLSIKVWMKAVGVGMKLMCEYSEYFMACKVLIVLSLFHWG